MDTHVIEVEKRDTRGKGNARKMRAAGKIPGVVYGHQEAPISVTLDPRVLERHLTHSGKRRNTLFELAGLGRQILCLTKDLQVDPVKRDLLHIDFFEVREGDRVLVDVPMVYTGRPEGVVKGGKLEGTRRTLRLDCSPLAIPTDVKLEITKMQIGDTIRVKDLDLPEGVKPALEANATVATIRAPRASDAAGEGEGEKA
jgi:large subunit ribosomal protein L25